MSKIHLSANSEALQAYFLEEISNHPKQKIFEKQKFGAKFGEIALFPESNQLYIGYKFENKIKNIDPYAKADYLNLGAKLGNFLKKTAYTEIQLNTLILIQKELDNFLLGLMQGSREFDKYKKDKSSIDLQIYVNQNDALDFVSLVPQESLLRTEHRKFEFVNALDYAMTLTRNLIDETPEAINPNSIVDIIKSEFSQNENTRINIFDYDVLQDMKMDAIVSVGRGSIKKPVLVHTIVSPKSQAKKKIVLVGKGLTYDSGGLDIKGGGHMKGMKMDMGGSATMFGTTKALANLGLENVEVHWISAFAENMLDSNAYKSDDIITSFSGQTIEVYNTDAEGRLTLADALAYATTLNPDYIIDAATLTGACIVALSEHFTAFMTNSQYLKDNLLTKFEECLEPTIYTPMPERLRKYVKGENSDLMNTSHLDRQSGHVTAGLFLSHFVDQNNFRNSELKIENPKCYDWVHLDIAGSAMNNKHNQLETNGATGQSIKSLVSWILDEDKKLN